MADYVYEQLTGEPGFFSTRLAYVRKEAGRQVLIIATPTARTPSRRCVHRQPIISLAWSPDGNKLAYVSFESGKAAVYVHELQTGRRTVVANYRGSNSARPGRPMATVAVVLTKDGSSQVYVMNADGSSQGGCREPMPSTPSPPSPQMEGPSTSHPIAAGARRFTECQRCQ